MSEAPDLIVTVIPDVVASTIGGPGDVVAAQVEDQALGATLLFFDGEGTGGPGEGPGGGEEDEFEFLQPTPATIWTIAHNLGRRPGIDLLTVGGMKMFAETIHLDENVAQAFFLTPTAGRAICS